MKKIKINKRGDIPVVILVIGVFAICTLAILSFKFASIKSDRGFSESIEAMQEMNSEIQKYQFYKDVGLDDSELRILFNIKGDKYLEVEKKLGEETIILVRYSLPEK